MLSVIVIMNFRYNCKHRNLGQGVSVKEPILPITLIGKNTKLDFTAILDSGSVFVLIPKEVADALEIDYSKGIEIEAESFEGKKFITKIITLNMEIKKGRERAPIQCKAAVSINGPNYNHIILGSSFFEGFEIIFDYPTDKFLIKR